MNSNLLKGTIKSNGDTQAALARAMKISLSGLNKKINGKDGADFYRNEIQKIKERYNLSHDEVGRIFFDQTVS